MDSQVSDRPLESLLVNDLANDCLALRYPRITTAADVTYEIEVGSDLIGWSPSQAVVDIMDHGDGTEIWIVRDFMPLQDPTTTRRFMRLRVIQE